MIQYLSADGADSEKPYKNNTYDQAKARVLLWLGKECW